jgi:hypothetical protein
MIIKKTILKSSLTINFMSQDESMSEEDTNEEAAERKTEELTDLAAELGSDSVPEVGMTE